MDKNWENTWVKPIRRVGMITLLLAAAMTFTPLIYLYLTRGILPPINAALTAWGMVAAAFGAAYIVEPVSYYAILGMAGTYMSFLTGNIGNLRVPCSAMAQEVVGVTEGTKKGEIIGTLGITGSVITNLIGVTLAAIIGMEIIAILPAVIVDGFRNYTAPAIFGAVYGQFAMRYIKLAPIGIGIPLIMIGIFNAPIWVAILTAVFGTMGIARIMFNKGIIEP